MASEPTDESVSISLPADLADWVDQQATEQDADRETVLLGLLAAQRAAEEMQRNGEVPEEAFAAPEVNVEAEVRDILAERMGAITNAVADQLDVESKVADALDEQFTEVSSAAAEEATDQVDGRLDDLESDFTAKVEDVRERVVELGDTVETKAAAEHEHPDLAERIDSLTAEVESLREEVGDFQGEIDDHLDEYEDRATDVDDQLSDVQQKLRTVAHAVNDLKESEALNNKRATSVDQIKQSAAEHDLDRAACEACGEGVEIALMTDPECPYCETTVTHVKPKEGFLGKPMLVKARGIEPADGES